MSLLALGRFRMTRGKLLPRPSLAFVTPPTSWLTVAAIRASCRRAIQVKRLLSHNQVDCLKAVLPRFSLLVHLTFLSINPLLPLL